MKAVATLRDCDFLKACRRETTRRTPVWLMRQAGRYMKEYRAIREKHSFLDICRSKDLVVEVTVGAQEFLGADAAILFADILLVADAMGLGLSFQKGDGPSLSRPVQTSADVDALPGPEAVSRIGYVFDNVRAVRAALKKDVPLIGFAGAPFTIASYMIEGGATRDFEKTRRFMTADSGAWNALLTKIARLTADYLNGQISAGAQAVQVFDSWVGCLEGREYEDYVLPHSRALLSAVKGAPVIHFGTGTGPFLERFASAGGDVIGVDHRIPLDEAWRRVGDKAIQGNLDPLVLTSSLENIERHVKLVLEQAAGRPGHIFNLGHGVLPETPPDHAIAAVELVHRLTERP